MGEMDNQESYVKALQARFEKKHKENEKEILEYWKAHLDRIVAMKPEGISSLQTQIKKVSDMMANRLMILKRDRHD